MAILFALNEQSQTGDALRQALGENPAAFNEVTRKLWTDGLIQGQLADGCCSSPCGTMCVSAMKPARVWQLSKRGKLRIKVFTAKHQS